MLNKILKDSQLSCYILFNFTIALNLLFSFSTFNANSSV